MANQPQKFKQIKAEPTENSGTKGSFARYDRLQAMFPSSPLYTDYKDEQIEALGLKKLFTEDVTNDYFGTVSRNYANNEPPSYDNVETGGGGLPASAWVPNPVSPGEGMNPADQGAAPTDYGTVPNPQWGNGPGVVNMSPSHSSTKIKEGITIGGTNGIQDGAGTRSWPNGDAG